MTRSFLAVTVAWALAMALYLTGLFLLTRNGWNPGQSEPASWAVFLLDVACATAAGAFAGALAPNFRATHAALVGFFLTAGIVIRAAQDGLDLPLLVDVASSLSVLPAALVGGGLRESFLPQRKSEDGEAKSTGRESR